MSEGEPAAGSQAESDAITADSESERGNLEQEHDDYLREIATRTWNYAQILDVFARASIHSDDIDRRYVYLSATFGVTEDSLAQPIAKARARRQRLDDAHRTRREEKP